MLQGLGFEICSGGIIGMGESKEDVVDMLLELREIRPEALPINFLLPIPGTPLEHADMSALTTAYCMKVLCLARLLVPQSDIRCAAGREIYFKGEEKNLLRVVDSIFASGYLTAGIAGIVIDKFTNRGIQILGMIVGTAICYAFGTAWFCLQAGYTVGAALAVCVIPFIPADLCKMVIAMIIGPMVRKRLGAVAQQ